MALDITALEVSLHNNLESELEADRQKDATEGTHKNHRNHQPKGFFGKIWDGLKAGLKHSITSENLSWAGTVAIASIAATAATFGIIAGVEFLNADAFKNLGSALSNAPLVGEVTAEGATNFAKMIGLSTFLPITFGFARAFRDGYGENDRHAQKHKEHEKGRGKALEHAQGHGHQQSREQQRVNGTVAPIPILTTAMKTEPAAPHAHANATERPAYLQNILAQGPSGQNRNHVAALEESRAAAPSSQALG